MSKCGGGCLNLTDPWMLHEIKILWWLDINMFILILAKCYVPCGTIYWWRLQKSLLLRNMKKLKGLHCNLPYRLIKLMIKYFKKWESHPISVVIHITMSFKCSKYRKHFVTGNTYIQIDVDVYSLIALITDVVKLRYYQLPCWTPSTPPPFLDSSIAIWTCTLMVGLYKHLWPQGPPS